jgi:hypothetical protein
MKKHLSKRRVIVAAFVAVALAIASSVAYAYWTAGGSGAGSGTAAGTPLVVNPVQTTVLTAMYPGDTAQGISGKFNNTNTGPMWVAKVTASIGTVIKAGGAPAGTCDATDFTLANPVATVGAEIPAGSNMGAWSGPSIKFNDKPAVDQSGCEGATVNLTYTASGS